MTASVDEPEAAAALVPTDEDEIPEAVGEPASKSKKGAPANKKSKLDFMKGILPKYFDSSWSYARFRIPTELADQRWTCAFNK